MDDRLGLWGRLVGSFKFAKRRMLGTNGSAKVVSGDLLVSGTRVFELLYEQLMARNLQFEHRGCSPPHFWCLDLHMSHVGVRCVGLVTR